MHQMWTYKLNLKSAEIMCPVGWWMQLTIVSRERSVSDCLTLKKTAKSPSKHCQLFTKKHSVTCNKTD